MEVEVQEGGGGDWEGVEEKEVYANDGAALCIRLQKKRQMYSILKSNFLLTIPQFQLKQSMRQDFKIQDSRFKILWRFKHHLPFNVLIRKMKNSLRSIFEKRISLSCVFSYADFKNISYSSQKFREERQEKEKKWRKRVEKRGSQAK